MIVLWNGDKHRDGDEDEVGDGNDVIRNRNGDSVEWEGVGRE